MSLVRIKKLMIANRGEIACRIIRTARRMNIQTVAVYSSADRYSMHSRMADESYHLGDPEPQKSYLNQEKLLSIAHRAHCGAIHPGYGFLSENHEFCSSCEKGGLIFVGPSAQSIRSMGLKNESKQIMIDAGVPVVPGYHGEGQTNERLLEEANKIGYPIMLKPVRGGGGKGMRVIENENDFLQNLESSRRESLKSFNDDSMLLEKFIINPRHIEVQIFGDKYGNYVHLFERDCSIQRRHQKIIEEAPAPLVSEKLRQHVGELAVKAARAVEYVGAGTVEFIMDRDTNELYFMEMNTRLQVEHPITEEITNTDLVEWQLRVAAGESLPKSQQDIVRSGHAFEARIYAENPQKDFLPEIGKLNYVSLPHNDLNDSRNSNDGRIRVDTGVEVGTTISPYYDPMIAKLIVWDKTRKQALELLRSSLSRYKIFGVNTNIEFLLAIAENKNFENANFGTDFLTRHPQIYEELSDSNKNQTSDGNLEEQNNLLNIFPQLSAAIVRLTLNLFRPKDVHDSSSSAFRILGLPPQLIKLNFSEHKLSCLSQQYQAHIEYSSSCPLKFKLTIYNTKSNSIVAGPEDISWSSSSIQNDQKLTIELNGFNSNNGTENSGERRLKFDTILLDDEQNVDLNVLVIDGGGISKQFKFPFTNYMSRVNDDAKTGLIGGGEICMSPMPGLVEKILVKVGDKVERGQQLIVMSAMKMEYPVKSSVDGKIESIYCNLGDFMQKGAELIKILADHDLNVDLQTPQEQQG